MAILPVAATPENIPSMRQRWFFVERLDAGEAILTGDQARHAARVLRLAVGDAISLFDAGDRRAHGTIARIDADRVVIRLEPTSLIPEAAGGTLPTTLGGLTLATAIPKGDRADWLIEKCAELGVAAVWPVNYERSVVTPGPAKIERWRRKVIEAAKQAMPPRLLKIEAPCDLLDLRDRLVPNARLWFGEPGHEPPTFFSAAMAVAQAQPCPQAVFFIGPEGGLTDHERDWLRNLGATPVSLGSSVLRIETASVAAASAWASLTVPT